MRRFLRNAKQQMHRIGYHCRTWRDIDAARANAAKERATARLAGKNEDLDVDRAKYALKKAMMRLRVTEALGKK